ncbi:MAG: hypothetical protein L0Y76_09360, partial [Ignavibacteria bacterium]|nr:hypothetical protein [Ignavibacteria bacterium]
MKNTGSIGKGTGVLITIVFLLFNNILFGQWLPSGSSALSNIGSWPSVCVVDESVIFVVGGNSTVGERIYRSTNGGTNFTSLNTPTSSTSRFISCVWAKNKDTIFVGEGSPSGNGLAKNVKFYRTTNGGTSWTELGGSGNSTNGFFNGIVFSSINPNVGIAHCDPNGLSSGNFQVWKTTNGGFNWTYFTMPAPNSYGAQNSLFVVDDNFFGFGLSESTARVGITTNGGTNWSYVALPGATSTQGFVSAVAFNTDKLNGYA